MKYLKYFAARLCEASTYAAIATVLVSASTLAGPSRAAAVAVGLIGVFIPS